MIAEPDVRTSPIAGTWYPGETEELMRSIRNYLDHAGRVDVKGEIKGLIVPHAGHVYSGQVAAYAYSAVSEQTVKTVAIISPMHQYHPAPLLTSSHAAYWTPLGDVPINHEILKKINQQLQSSTGLSLNTVAHDQEHSLEIQLPFLQTIYPHGFELIPIMLRDQSADVAHPLAAALAACLPPGSLLIASSDLSHFYTASEARILDEAILKAILKNEPEEVYRVEARGEGYACGLGAITTILWASRHLGANQVQLLNQSTSADVTGDASSVVGYGAAAIYQSP